MVTYDNRIIKTKKGIERKELDRQAMRYEKRGAVWRY